MSYTEFRKANPLPSDAYVAPLLTSVAFTYLTGDAKSQSAAMAVAPQSVVPVDFQTGYFQKYNKGDILRGITEPRAPSGAFAVNGMDVDNSGMYSCVTYGLEALIPDELRANDALKMNLDRMRTLAITQAAVRRREQKFADTLFATSGSWDKVVNGTTGSPVLGTSFKQWSAAGSTPIADIKYAKRYILDSTGLMANTLILPHAVWDTITENGDVVDRLSYSNRGTATPDIFAELCGLKRVVIGSLARETGNKGGTSAISNPIGDKALLCYLPEAPGIGQMAAFQQFVWAGLLGSEEGMRVLKLRDDRRRQDVLQIEDAFDIKITCADLGFLFNDCT